MKKSQKNRENKLLIRYEFERLELQKFENYSPIDLLEYPQKDHDPLKVGWSGPESQTKNYDLRPITTPFVKNIKKPFKTRQIDIGHFTPQGKSQVVNEEKWLAESFNYLNSVWTNRVTLVLEENHDKLKFSIFKFAKKRQVGHKYFGKVSEDIHLTFNKTTKNFFITTSKFFNRKRHTSTRKNSVLDLKNTINTISFNFFMQKLISLSTTESLSSLDYDLDTHPQLKKFIKKLQRTLNDKLKVKFNFNEGIGPGLVKGTLDWFVKERKIKVPNDYYNYMFNHYPGIRKLKKYKNNLGRAILDNMELKGKYYIKLINTHGGYNLTDLITLKKILGPKFVKLIPLSFLKLTNYQKDSKENIIQFNPDHPFGWNLKLSLHKTEKLNLLKLLKDVANTPQYAVTFLRQLEDHLRIRSKNLEHFNMTHTEWSNLIHIYQRNIETHYLYSSKFLKELEEPIIINNKEYEVKVLKNDKDYFEEGQIQHHCVRSYLDRYDSIIVSVRNKSDVLERMTVEFKGESSHSGYRDSIKDYRGRTMVQSQMKFNQPPIGEWEKVRSTIHHTFMNLKNIESPEIMQYNKITGKKLKFTQYHGKIDGERFDFNETDLPF